MKSLMDYSASLAIPPVTVEEHTFPVWVGVNRDTKSNEMMSFIHDVWANRDESSLIQVTSAFEVMNGKSFRGGIFDIKTIGDVTTNKLDVHTCEFRHFAFCNWNELMVIRDNVGLYCYTPLRMRLRMILSESGDWIKSLGKDGYFYINGTADISDDGKLVAFGINLLGYKSYLATHHGPVGYEQILMKNVANGDLGA